MKIYGDMKNVKRYMRVTFCVVLCTAMIFFSSCKDKCGAEAAKGTDAGGSGGSNYWMNSGENGGSQQDPSSENIKVDVDYSDFDRTESWNESACYIELNGSSAEIKGNGADILNGSSIKGGGNTVIHITAGGTYVISGTLNDGSIRVEAGEEQVHIVLNGVNITCGNGAPFYANNGKKTVVTLAEGSVNTLTDSQNYEYAVTKTDSDTGEETGEPNAAMFSKKALTINGSGTLTVNGNFNNGITCKDDLKIMNGNITVTAQNHGIRGNDSVAVRSGTIDVIAPGDGIKSTKTGNALKGYVYIEGGMININAGDDGIQAETLLMIAGGEINIVSSDDAMHSDGNLAVSDGKISIRAKDDALHSDSVLKISGGSITVTESYEALEALTIDISGGTMHVRASDDGVNAAQGSSSSESTSDRRFGGGKNPGGIGGMGGGNPGGNPSGMEYDSQCQINISGGYLYIDADGDGIDSNGDITISGGTVIVNGPTSNGDGALDANGSILVSGGFLVSVGSSAMAEYPDGSSSQNVLVVTLSQMQSAGSLIRIVDDAGKDLLTFSSAKTYNSLVFSSPDIKSGTSYTVYTGGSYSGGDASDGLMANGEYNGGSQFAEVTVSAILTYAGSNPGGMGGNPFGGGGPGGGFGGGMPEGNNPGGNPFG